METALTTLARPRAWACGETAGTLLAELRSTHSELLEALDHKERVTTGATPAPNHCALVRWKLARARHRRSKLMTRIHARLLEDAAPEEAKTLRWLEADELQLCRRSAEHVQGWTMDRVTSDWPRYGEASAAFIACLRQRIVLEMQTLYPMLGARSE